MNKRDIEKVTLENFNEKLECHICGKITKINSICLPHLCQHYLGICDKCLPEFMKVFRSKGYIHKSESDKWALNALQNLLKKCRDKYVLKSEVLEIIDTAKELRDLMQGVIDHDYKPDSFTLQPIDNAILALQEAYNEKK